MEKLSYYNIFVPFHKGYTIIYNSCSGFYGLLAPETYDIILSHENDLNKLSKEYSDIYNKLKNNGCIVDSSLDEYQCIEGIRLDKRFNSQEYQLIINPTIDCNLGCWYCYEQHEPNSKIGEETIQNIINHLMVKYSSNPFKSFILSFFGGEPLLQEDRVIQILKLADEFCKEHNIYLQVEFTTNCTVLSDNMLGYLKCFDVRFQITLDGDKEKHNSVRHYKNSTTGSYDKILSNLKRITDNIDKHIIRLRINIDDKTLKNGVAILDSIDFLNRKQSYIGVHKVWQVNETSMDVEQILEFIAEASKRKFKVEFQQMGCMRDHICYADLYNEAVINYNGNVYKCTARTFSDENKEGVLTRSGKILWNADKIRKRTFLKTPDSCVACKLFPACTGFCSQHLIEEGEDRECTYLKFFSIEEQVIINFQQNYLQNNTSRL